MNMDRLKGRSRKISMPRGNGEVRKRKHEVEIMTSAFAELRAYADTLPIIDAHEHFISEPRHVQHYLSFFHYLTSYLQWDLYSAGMPKEMLWHYPTNEDEETRWFEAIEPLWPYVKHGSYARPIRLAWREFYGIADLTRSTYLEIGRQMRHNNYPGRYDAIFNQARICAIINQSPDHPFDDPRFIYGRPFQYFAEADLTAFFADHPSAALEDLLGEIDTSLRAAKQRGARSAKFFSANLMHPPDADRAAQQVAAIKQGRPVDWEVLWTFLYDYSIGQCRVHDLVAAIHTGVWTDLNKQTPELIFPVVERHPETRFDVYHMGMPYVRQCAFLGKNYPNVSLNLCWAYAVSETIAQQGLDEWLDLVPVNKLIGFGGDLITIPEHVWGQLAVAKEVIARVLTERITRQRLDKDEAKMLMRLWFYENPKRIYQLDHLESPPG